MNTSPATFIESLVLEINHRNGGSLVSLDPSTRLLDPSLGLDSLDLAEVMAAVEKRFGVSPFNAERPPRTWADVAADVSPRP